jgi:DNA-binding PadR family transcriptional regulator
VQVSEARELSPGEWAVLGAIAQSPTHGFAIAQLLAPHGELGRVWSMRRPLVYQSLRKLDQLGLIEKCRTERSGRGPERTILAATPAGEAAIRRWLSEPVDHVRDVRSSLLLKLALLNRAGNDPRPLLEAQRQRLRPQLAALERTRDESVGFDEVLAEWRLTSSVATLDFIDAITATTSTGRRR